jgi:hypothetical protein
MLIEGFVIHQKEYVDWIEGARQASASRKAASSCVQVKRLRAGQPNNAQGGKPWTIFALA